MIQTERRIYLIKELLKEQPWYEGPEIPEDEAGQKRLLRSLCIKKTTGYTGGSVVVSRKPPAIPVVQWKL